MTQPDTRTSTDSILTHLATTGLQVGDGVAPADSARPYLVAYNLGPFATGGPLRGANEDQWLEFQVTSVGDTREQAEWAQMKARTVMVDDAITPPSGYSWGRSPILVPGQGTTRDDTYQPALFYAVDVYRLLTTPA